MVKLLVPLEAKPVSGVHNELRIRLLERIVFINISSIVMQIEVRVPAPSGFQRAAGCGICSDD